MSTSSSNSRDLSTLSEENPNPILRVQKNGTIIYANKPSKIILEYWHTHIGNNIPADWQNKIEHIYECQQPSYEELYIDEIIYSLHVVPINNSGYVNIYALDVTTQRNADRMKSEFVSLASHQLRSPLTAVRWLTERLVQPQTGPLNESQQEIARLLRETSLRLIHLVNDLLNISRLETGRMTVEPQLTDIKQLIQQAIDDLQYQIEQKKHQVTCAINPEVPAQLSIDPQLIHEVISNLISNAVKYTPDKGNISIEITSQSDQVEIVVKDNGYGIPSSEHSKIFGRFYRATNVATKDIDGTGLGLYLVKLIVEASGGKIWFESQVDQGTTFYFTLPREGSHKRDGEVKLTF